VAEPGALVRRQLGDSFGDLFDFHAAQYSTCAGRQKKPHRGDAGA
jgi:hypothetical protein